MPNHVATFQVRHRLRKEHGIEGGIPVVFSLEKPKAKLLPFVGPSGEEENPSDYQVKMFAYSLELSIILVSSKCIKMIRYIASVHH